MDHPFAYRAHYREDGEICHCPWGIAPGHEHLGSVKEASKLKWLEERPDMSDSRNRMWLEYLKGSMVTPFASPEEELKPYDKLLPWLHREFKKGRLLPSSGPGPRGTMNYMPNGEQWDPNHVIAVEGKPWFTRSQYVGQSLDPGDLEDWQQHLEEMKKRGKGIDVMQHKVHELAPKIQDFKDWKEAQKRQDLGEVLHKFDDGWTVRRLQNAAEHADEGSLMGHCIGGSGYSDETENGGPNMYVSLRDQNNLPHASMQIRPDHWEHQETGETAYNAPGTPAEGWIPQVGPGSQVGEFYGKQDRAPEPEYQGRMQEWLDPYKVSAEGGPLEAPEMTLEPAYNVDSYNSLHGENGDWMEWLPETDAEGRPYGENTEVMWQPPEWDKIAKSWLDNDVYENNQYRGGTQEFFDTVRREHHTPAFEQAMSENFDPGDPTHVAQMEKWQKLKEPYYHPLTGEYFEGYGDPPLTEYQKPLFHPRTEQEIQPKEIVRQMEFNPDAPESEDRWIRRGPQQGPINDPFAYWPSYTSATIQPLYYRWIFSPSKGVTLGTNSDAHPALVKYHQGLGGDINDTDLSHGYAYPIGNGWRLTDYEHRPVDDPYIVNAVVRKLNHDPGQIFAEGSWRPVEYDWDRLHYGLPQEKVKPL